MDNKWDTEFPTKEGWYWFYGYPWGKGKDDKPRLDMIKIVMGGQDHLFGTLSNSFVYKQQCKGMFYEVNPPELPELERKV